MKILETIQGAVQNTVIYLDESGEKKVITRPSVCPIKDIITEIDKPKAAPQKTVFDAPNSASDALSGKRGINTQNQQIAREGANNAFY